MKKSKNKFYVGQKVVARMHKRGRGQIGGWTEFKVCGEVFDTERIVIGVKFEQICFGRYLHYLKPERLTPIK